MDGSASTDPSTCAPLSLISPETGSSVSEPDSKNLNVDGPLQSIKLDELGPMVVNNDGVGVSFAFFQVSHQIAEAPFVHSLFTYYVSSM